MSQQKKDSLEAALLRVLQALDNQVAREMQRDPKEREQQGMQKWEPYAKRIEHIAGLVIDALSAGEVGVDGILILSQACAKILKITATDLGADGLGQLRTSYCLAAFEALEREAREGSAALKGGELH
ncbi:MAG: hypothetical protein QY326_07025 [Bdellovibrionota bacterium]|nr:MAG: hypothetical protein QY326_07025 [Bdellovibrionota bacterium]